MWLKLSLSTIVDKLSLQAHRLKILINYNFLKIFFYHQNHEKIINFLFPEILSEFKHGFKFWYCLYSYKYDSYKVWWHLVRYYLSSDFLKYHDFVIFSEFSILWLPGWIFKRFKVCSIVSYINGSLLWKDRSQFGLLGLPGNHLYL
jgi:hypothetical protein